MFGLRNIQYNSSNVNINNTKFVYKKILYNMNKHEYIRKFLDVDFIDITSYGTPISKS